MTDFFTVCQILGTLYADYKDDPKIGAFIRLNDIGMPLAYFFDSELIDTFDEGVDYVNDTWDLLLEELGVQDSGFKDVESLLDSIK